MNKIICISMAALALTAGGCSKKNTASISIPGDMPQAAPEAIFVSPTAKIGSPTRILLKTTVFRMNGDYADNVAVTMNADGTFSYYPAPSDISENSRPVDLGNGWWLNRQGIGPNARFLRYTFAEYASLPAVPTQEELKAAIIPGAEITDFTSLDIPASEAMSRLDEIRALLAK